MKLEIVLNEEKAKEHHYNIHKGYAKIEDFMIKQGFCKISEGVLEGDDSQKSFDSVLLINRELAKTKWFPLLVEKWWWHIDGEIEDCMGYITGVWEKKEEKPQIMRMEIVLSEEKAKLHGIDVNKGYKAIDDYFENRGVPKLGQGIYECIEDDNSFSTFSVAIAQLPETKWFPLLVEKWLWYIQGEVEDCISSLKGITL